MSSNKYYVYVYIDPRDFSEFYYGKGTGNRKDSHLRDSSDSEKAQIIQDIKRSGLEPIIKVIAKDLSEEEAFLIEKTLIWKLGKTLSNVSSGKFRDKFREHKTFHRDIHGFDYQCGIYFFNIGDTISSDTRSWEDMRKYSFISAGFGPKYAEPIKSFNQGDIFCAFSSRNGYVGIGRIERIAVPYRKFKVKGKPIGKLATQGNYSHDSHDLINCEWMCTVSWIKTVSRIDKAKWKSNAKLFAKQGIKSSLQDQKKTLDFLEDSFSVNFERITRRSASKKWSD